MKTNIITILALALLTSCTKSAILVPETPNTDNINLGYVRYNDYIQDLGCAPVLTTAYNSYDSITNTLTLHNDSLHMVFTHCQNVSITRHQAYGHFTTQKGEGHFAYVPCN